MTYTLGKLERCGDSFAQQVLGAKPSERGGATYFISLQDHKHKVPRFRAQYCDDGDDLADAGMQRGSRWRELAVGVTLQQARRAVRRHFEGTFGELDRREAAGSLHTRPLRGIEPSRRPTPRQAPIADPEPALGAPTKEGDP